MSFGQFVDEHCPTHGDVIKSVFAGPSGRLMIQVIHLRAEMRAALRLGNGSLARAMEAEGIETNALLNAALTKMKEERAK